MAQMLAGAQALALESLITPTEQGIASRILGKSTGGSLTLFSFDAAQDLTEHTSPFDAFLIVLSGRFALTIGGAAVDAPSGTIVRLPANVPHAVQAIEASRMLLVMLRDLAPS